MMLSGKDEAGVQVVSHLDLDGRKIDSILAEGGKLIRFLPSSRTYHLVESFDFTHDSDELENVATSRPVLTGRLFSLLKGALLEQPQLLTTSEAVIDGKLGDRLRALGYIH